MTLAERAAGNGGIAPGFDVLRLIAALTVVYSHAFLVSGFGAPWPAVFPYSPGSTAVIVFFALSGYVNTLSLQRRPRARSFLMRRARRLYPLLATTVVCTAFVLGPLVTRLDAADYWSAPGTWLYLVSAVLPLWQVLPGVFDTAPVPWVNGSLWTLRYEIVCYLGMALCLPLFVRHRRLCAIAAPLLALTAGTSAQLLGSLDLAVPAAGKAVLIAALPLFAAFGAGVSVALHQRRLPGSGMAALGGIVVAVAALASPLASALFPFACAYAVVATGQQDWLRSRLVGGGRTLGDMSYGIYVLAFPIQQVIGSAIGPMPWVNLAISVPTVGALAFLSWRLLEAPALDLGQASRLKGKNNLTN